MAIIDLTPELMNFPPTGPNQYAERPDSFVVRRAIEDLLVTETPYIDKSTHPDIAGGGTDFIVYKIDGSHPAAAISRAIEGSVMRDDWQQNPEQSEHEAAVYEDNSLFFLVIDASNPLNPQAAASLRIADALTGQSETVQYYKAIHGEDVSLPPELTVTQEDVERGIWDVVGVMADKKYRGSDATAWAYHALYRASQEYDVHRWISNITDKEFGNLNGLGIPFKLIEGTDKVEMPREGKKPIVFGFYNINVDDIRPNMTEVIRNLEKATEHKDFYALLAKLSRIAMDGQFTAEKIAA